MSRSLKKGPFVDDHLLKKVDTQNAAGESDVPRTPHRHSFHPHHEHSDRLCKTAEQALTPLLVRALGVADATVRPRILLALLLTLEMGMFMVASVS